MKCVLQADKNVIVCGLSRDKNVRPMFYGYQRSTTFRISERSSGLYDLVSGKVNESIFVETWVLPLE